MAELGAERPGAPGESGEADLAPGNQGRYVLLLLMALVFSALALLSSGTVLHLTAALAATTLAVLVLGLRVQDHRGAMKIRRGDDFAWSLVESDAAPSVITDGVGRVLCINEAAGARFGTANKDSLTGLLRDHVASPGAVLFRLQSRALAPNGKGHAREDVVTRHGHARISAHRIGPMRVLWRLEEFQDKTAVGRGAEQLSLPMLTASKAGVVLYTNEAMRRLLGGRPKRLDRVFTGPVQRSGEEVEVTTAEGRVRAILAEIEGPGERREIYLLPVAREVEDTRVLADFEHVPVALAKFSGDGVLCGANRAARELLLLAEGQDVMVHDLLEGLGRPVTDWLSDVHAERLPGGSEVLLARGGDGEENFVQVTMRRIVEQGRAYVLAVLQDANQFKRLEAQFVQSQKMQAIGQLAGGVAHDFNNLLTAISGHCDLLLIRHDREDPDYADLMQIHQNANRAAALVGQLLAFSRKQTLKPENLDLEDVLSELGHLLNRLVGERIALRTVHDPSLRQIRADRRQLEQVIMNLVVNARDAIAGEAGTIKIETEALTLLEPLRRDRAAVPAGEWAVIRVTDTGCGIPPERLEKIFEPFFTTKKAGEGTGLGLSTAYGIVKQSGGFIFVDSTPGEGTIFSLYFPTHEPVEKPAATLAAAPAAELRPGEGVVLLVEDEAPVRAFASRALRMRGYTVLEAGNAEEALAALEDPALAVDLFVTDVVMPGMDGPSWVRQAMELRPDVKVIFVSGYSEDALQETRARIPNSVFLPKPFSLSDLTRTVQDQLH